MKRLQLSVIIGAILGVLFLLVAGDRCPLCWTVSVWLSFCAVLAKLSPVESK